MVKIELRLVYDTRVGEHKVHVKQKTVFLGKVKVGLDLR